MAPPTGTAKRRISNTASQLAAAALTAASLQIRFYCDGYCAMYMLVRIICVCEYTNIIVKRHTRLNYICAVIFSYIYHTICAYKDIQIEDSDTKN